jgi:hypothetical protein
LDTLGHLQIKTAGAGRDIAEASAPAAGVLAGSRSGYEGLNTSCRHIEIKEKRRGPIKE